MNDNKFLDALSAVLYDYKDEDVTHYEAIELILDLVLDVIENNEEK